MINEKLIEELRLSLMSEKNKLKKELDKIAVNEDGDYQTRFEDFGREEEQQADEVENYVNKVGVTETLEEKYRQINQALERMEKGTYGFCQKCQKEISVERLKVNPSAENCMACENKNA